MKPPEDQIVQCIQIQGVYDGVCVYVTKDGKWHNRFDDDREDFSLRWERTNRYIRNFGPQNYDKETE